jgi:short-subunit dehydrogenase
MKKNLIIIGAGPGLSTGIAEKFGKEGFSIGLVSRNAEKLTQQVSDLEVKGVSAYYATADAYNKDSLSKGIATLQSKMGTIQTLVYNAAALKMKNILDETSDELVEDLKISVANAFHSVKNLHLDLKATKGSVLLTGGYFAIEPNKLFGSLSLGKAALRNLAFQLNDALEEDEIYVGTVTINGYIQHSSKTHSPKILAEKFWELHQNRNTIEIQY